MTWLPLQLKTGGEGRSEERQRLPSLASTIFQEADRRGINYRGRSGGVRNVEKAHVPVHVFLLRTACRLPALILFVTTAKTLCLRGSSARWLTPCLRRYRQPGLLCTPQNTKLCTKFKIFRKKIFFGTKVTSEAFLSSSQNLKFTRLQGCTKTKRWPRWRNFGLSRSFGRFLGVVHGLAVLQSMVWPKML